MGPNREMKMLVDDVKLFGVEMMEAKGLFIRLSW